MSLLCGFISLRRVMVLPREPTSCRALLSRWPASLCLCCPPPEWWTAEEKAKTEMHHGRWARGPNGCCKFYANNPFSMQDSDPGWQKTKGWIIRERCERCGLSQTTQKKHRMIPTSIIANLHIWLSLCERKLLRHSERFQIRCKRRTQATHTRADNQWIKKRYIRKDHSWDSDL